MSCLHWEKGSYLQRKLNAPTAPIIELIRALIEVNLWTRTNQLLRSILSGYCAREAQSAVFSNACQPAVRLCNDRILESIAFHFFSLPPTCFCNTMFLAGASLQAIRASLRGQRRLQDATARKERHCQNQMHSRMRVTVLLQRNLLVRSGIFLFIPIEISPTTL